MQVKPLDYQALWILKTWRNKHRMYLRQTGLLTNEDQSKWYEGYKIQNDHKFYYIQEGEKILGFFGLTYIDYINRVAEISFITENYFDETSELLLTEAENIAFNELNMNKVFVEIIEYDPKKELLHKLRYIHEGELRQTYYKNGHYFNSNIYGLIINEYRIRE